jgi:hypothetical protein
MFWSVAARFSCLPFDILAIVCIGVHFFGFLSRRHGLCVVETKRRPWDDLDLESEFLRQSHRPFIFAAAGERKRCTWITNWVSLLVYD